MGVMRGMWLAVLAGVCVVAGAQQPTATLKAKPKPAVRLLARVMLSPYRLCPYCTEPLTPWYLSCSVMLTTPETASEP